MANSIQYNVGTFKGLLGTAVVYSAKTTGLVDFLCYKSVQTLGGVTADYWTYMSRSAMQSYLASGDATISSTIDLSKFADVAPTGLLNANGDITIGNDAGNVLPKLYTSQPFYSLKGSDVATYTGDAGTPVSGAKDNSTVVISTSGSKTISEYMTEAATFASKNWILLIAIAFGVSEAFGWTNLLGFHKKTKSKGRK